MTIHGERVGDKVVLPWEELQKLLALAQQSEDVRLAIDDEDIPTVSIMKLAEESGAFAFLADEEDLYSVNDLKVRYR